MSRIPKVKRWQVTWTWTGAKAEVTAPTSLLAKMEGSQLVYGHPVRYGEFTARLLKGVAPVLKLG